MAAGLGSAVRGKAEFLLACQLRSKKDIYVQAVAKIRLYLDYGNANGALRDVVTLADLRDVSGL